MSDVYRIMHNHVLSDTSAAVTEPAPGLWDLNTNWCSLNTTPEYGK
jgi:hypothetical protein